MRAVFLCLATIVAVVVWVMGPRGSVSERPPIAVISDMDYQPRYNAQDASPFFSDRRTMRTPPAGTIAFGGGDYASDAGSPRQNPDLLQADEAYYKGKQNGTWIDQVPVKVDLNLLRRGQERYDIHCAVCHGATGSGKGIATQYGMVSVVSFHDPLHQLMPDGEYYNVITNGKGLMMPFASHITVYDRWAIVAYLRALMRSQTATMADVPEALRGGLK
jgi:mono/diheme cytochrome c family protein